MQEEKRAEGRPAVRLRARRMTPKEAEDWSVPYREIPPRRGDSYWTASIWAKGGKGTHFRVTAEETGERAAPEAVIGEIEGELGQITGRVSVTEVVDGAPVSLTTFDADRGVIARRRTIIVEDSGETSRLSMNIDPELHAAVKGKAHGAGLSVTRFVERVLDEAVSAAQRPRRGRG
ncbi:MAG: hypothetical protein M3P49_16800, partial [Actinomycetota bacterium]|nr:hypothetical protein [Actinomycetota bacterium]